MPRQQDVAAILKRLLTRDTEIADTGSNEVLDEIVALRDQLPPTDGLAVTEATDFRAVSDVGLAGYCEAVSILAEATASGTPGATVTVDLDLGAAPSRPVLVFSSPPAGGGQAAAIQQVRTRNLTTDAWGAWAALSSAGVTLWTPGRYLQVQIQLVGSAYRVGAYD